MPSKEPVQLKQFRIPHRLAEALAKDAADNDKSMNQIIVELLEAKYGEAGK